LEQETGKRRTGLWKLPSPSPNCPRPPCPAPIAKPWTAYSKTVSSISVNNSSGVVNTQGD
jgi:hypothetical protein